MGRQAPAQRRQAIRLLREALLDLTGVLNRPQPDAALIKSAGVDLDRALFPLLARIERRGPLGIVELAELAGRDYTTVSRQVAKLESIGVVKRIPGPKDRRIKQAAITPKGQVMIEALDKAREGIVTDLFSDWEHADVTKLAQLLRRFADGALTWTDRQK